MAEGTFTIIERPDLGGKLPPGGQAAQFDWNSDARNAPFAPWAVTLTQRTVRTDYPGTDTVSEQVLGPNYQPFTLNGKWRDKFNPQTPISAPDDFVLLTARQQSQQVGGYAQDTLNLFLAMVRRGNPVDVAYNANRGSLSFIGIITEFTFEYITPWEIAYEFTVSPHTRFEDEILTDPPSATQARDPANLVQETVEATEDIRAQQDTAPQTSLSGSIFSDVEFLVISIESGAKQLDKVIEQRVLSLDNNSNVSLRRAIGATDTIVSASIAVSNAAKPRKSDTSLMYSTPLGLLGFETWNRGSAYESRQTVFTAFETRQALDLLEDADAIALYRPFKNESFYGISNRFYGTPYNWQLIKDANKLASSNLTGEELLVIPRAPVQ